MNCIIDESVVEINNEKKTKVKATYCSISIKRWILVFADDYFNCQNNIKVSVLIIHYSSIPKKTIVVKIGLWIDLLLRFFLCGFAWFW